MAPAPTALAPPLSITALPPCYASLSVGADVRLVSAHGLNLRTVRLRHLLFNPTARSRSGNTGSCAFTHGGSMLEDRFLALLVLLRQLLEDADAASSTSFATLLDRAAAHAPVHALEVHRLPVTNTLSSKQAIASSRVDCFSILVLQQADLAVILASVA